MTSALPPEDARPGVSQPMAIATAVDLSCGPAPSRREPRIAIVAELRYFAQRQPAGLAAALATAGHRIGFLDPRDTETARRLGVDLVVARGRSPALLDLLEVMESRGVPTVNRRAAIAAVLDKAAMARSLAAAGIPTPPTRVGTPYSVAEATRASEYPLVVKPAFDHDARAVRVVCSREELLAGSFADQVVVAQQFLASDGFDLKLYVVGREVNAVRSRSRFASGPACAYAVETTPALRALALRCGALFALELFGVDCVETPRGPVVIDVNDFPNYSGVDGADGRLARYVIARARRGGRGGERQ